MTTFITIYRRDSLATAELVAVSVDPGLDHDVTQSLLHHQQARASSVTDPALSALAAGKQQALWWLCSEARDLIHLGAYSDCR